MQPPKPFTVIGGFLGAGKTTLLNHILSSTNNVRYAVLVNDFGAINIDESLIKSHDGQTLALSNGCICCSMSNGFINTMLKLMQTPDAFDQIIVEASGVSEPDRIMDFARLDPALTPNSITVLVDAAEIKKQLVDKHISEIVHKQIQSANVLLLNKKDKAKRLDIIEHSLRGINAHAEITVCQNAAIDLKLLDKASAASTQTTEKGDAFNSADFETRAFTIGKPVDRISFNEFAKHLPEEVIRGKGILIFDDEPDTAYVWQKVGGTSTLSLTDTKPAKSKIVLIATNQFSPDFFDIPFAELRTVV